MNHPFVSLADMRRVDLDLRVCVLAVVEQQPGAVVRTTPFGQGKVCNALLRMNNTSIRASFWRASGEALATHAVGTAVAIYQAIVRKAGAGAWELRATESTLIEEFLAELRDQILADTDISRDAEERLTTTAAVDYDTAPATLSCQTKATR